MIRYIQTMRNGGKTLVCVLSALVLDQGVQAVNSDSAGGPYRGIVARNVFDIKPAPPPVDPASIKPPAPPPPNIRLNGIMDILGRRQVLMKVQLPAKPPAAAKEEAYVLSEGQREGEIEVLEINIKAGTVKINNYGTITNLSLELNAEKLANTQPPAVPAQPAPITPGGLIPPTLPTLPAAGKFPRTLRLPGSTGSQPNPPNQTAAHVPGNADQKYSFNTAEEQEVMIEALRQQSQNQGTSLQDFLPPTRINPTANTVLHPHVEQAPQ